VTLCGRCGWVGFLGWGLWLVFSFLACAGANPNLGSRTYRLPLDSPCGGARAVRMLLAAGADPKSETPEGKPAFSRHGFHRPGGFPDALERGANLLR